MSLDSKFDEMSDFYMLLKTFNSAQKKTSIETKDRKDRIMKYVKPLCDEYFNACKKNYDSKNVKDEKKKRA